MDTLARSDVPAQASRRHRPRRRLLRRVFVVTSALSAVFLTVVGAWTAYGVVQIDNAVRRVDVAGLVGSPPVTTVAVATTLPPTTLPADLSAPTDGEFAVDPNAVTAAPDARFFLLLGLDSRAGHRYAKTQGMTDAGRSDVMIVARVMPGRPVKLLSVPRDYRVRIPGRGREKITHAHAYGGMSLSVETVTAAFGIPVSHVASVNFAGFEKVVKAVDGVQVCLEHAERDRWADMEVPAGCTELDPPSALAYSRSRKTEVRKGGRWVTDPTGDIGRMRRQQAILSGIMRKVATPQGIADLPDIAASLDGAVTVDRGLRLGAMLDLARSVAAGGGELERAVLPGDGVMLSGSYQVKPNASTQTMIDDFKSGR